ncbi:MAG: efflux RND transporter periplasmic adaptor subunit [Gammaproteobacteria bacterium]|nr:efflux RND transporter periplasmic adaptor subunit [Gammaproteobacteria bacterium]
MIVRKVLFSSVLALAATTTACGPGQQSAPTPVTQEARKPLYYRSPMDPGITSDVPRKDSMNMDYIPVYAGTNESGVVALSGAMVNKLGVRTAPVRRGALAAEVRAVGLTAYDERGRVDVRVRTEGYVERLAVRAAGETVRRGQLLFAAYSPRLAAAQREFKAALAMGDGSLVESAAARLHALGLGDAAIKALREGGVPAERVSYFAPIDGVVVDLGVRDGGFVEPGVSAMMLAPLDRLWVIAELPESQASAVTAGFAAIVTFGALPGQQYEVRVLELLPAVNAETRTVQARLTLPNPGRRFAAGMVANVTLAAGTGADSLLMPLAALIRTEKSERVIVSLGEGLFIAREVVAGRQGGDEVEILRGLEGNEQVVVSGQFMIDSESQLRSGLARFDGDAGEAQ